jgi:hypothetical protein
MVEQSLDKRSVIGSNPIGSMRSHLKYRKQNQILPCGVIGNTPDFDSGILGSIPSEAVRVFIAFYIHNLLSSSKG